MKPPSTHPNIHCQMDGCSSEGCPVIWVRGGLGAFVGTWDISAGFEGCVEVCWEGSMDLDKG